MSIELRLTFTDATHVMVSLLGANPDASPPAEFTSPLKEADLNELRWYLEDYGTSYAAEPDDARAKAVEELELKNPYNLADYQSGKLAILDIKARDSNGRWINVEMQMTEDRNFDKRAIYYWAGILTRQLAEGSIYEELTKTISINILDFNFVPDADRFHNRYKIINVDTLKEDSLHDIFELHYVELKKFRKQFHELAAPLDRWAAFLSRAGELDKEKLPPTIACDPALVRAVMAVDRLFDEDEREIYEARRQAIIDQESKIASALKAGMEQGMEKGILQVARNLLDILDDAGIAEKTGLSLSAVQKLRQGKI
ncbi:MAG: Rpn family recombination-promoting nuclease/putative transposase [Candidatus Electrothrix sp. YB6]